MREWWRRFRRGWDDGWREYRAVKAKRKFERGH